MTKTTNFRETIQEFWRACGDRRSWESGYTDVLAKKITWMATQDLSDWEQTTFEAAMLNYSMRKVRLDSGLYK